MKKYIALIGVFLTQDALSYTSYHHSSSPDHLLGVLLATLILSFVFYIIGQIIGRGVPKLVHGTKRVKSGIKKQYKNHKDNQEKYRKYLRDSDKQGKTPLSYKQWKFAYVNRKHK